MLVITRKFIMILIDAILIGLALGLSFLIFFGWHGVENSAGIYIFAVVVKIMIFYFCGLYQWSFRYASFSEALNVFVAVTLGTFIMVVSTLIAHHPGLAHTILVLDYFFCLMFITFSRFSPRAIIKLKQTGIKHYRRAIIVGAGAAGQMVAKELLSGGNRLYEPVGFVDDDPLKLHARIQGIKVLGKISEISKAVTLHHATDIIIAIPSASGLLVRTIVTQCKEAGVPIKTIPALHKILTGEITVTNIRQAQSEDLLGRETVDINTDEINRFIKGKIVLVTGAAGSIGRELCRQIAKFSPREIIFFDHNENDLYFLQLELKKNFPDIPQRAVIGDIRDIGLLKKVFSVMHPNVVFHSAAHKHVPLMEENPAAAIKNNVIGTRNLMYAAQHYGVESFVMISTDKAVRPTSVMGASKRIAEMIMLAKADNPRTKFMAVRFGNVIGSSGSVVPIFKKQIEQGGPVTVTHPEVRRFFMTASEAAQLVMQAGAIGRGGEIFILDMGEQIKIVDLAKELIILSGLKPGEDIEIKFVGLRPGEKLYEEVLHNAEEDKTTKHDRIYITKPDNFDKGILRLKINRLRRLADTMDSSEIIKLIKELVPSYQPGNIG